MHHSSEHSNKSNQISGGSIAFAFSIVSLYLAFHNNTFGVEILWNLIFFLSVVVSLLGTAVELNKYIQIKFRNENLDSSNFFMGIILLAFFFSLHKYFMTDSVIVTILADLLKIALLLFGSAATLDGLIKITKAIFDNSTSQLNIKSSIKISAMFLVSLASFAASIIAILEAFNLIE